MNQDNEKDIDIQELGEDIPKNTKKTVKRLMVRLKNQKNKLIIVGVSALLSSAAYAVMPLVIGNTMDNILYGIQNLDGRTSLLTAVVQALYLPILILISITLISSLLAYIQQYIIASIGENLTYSLRMEISEKLHKLPLRYFDSHKKTS